MSTPSFKGVWEGDYLTGHFASVNNTGTLLAGENGYLQVMCWLY